MTVALPKKLNKEPLIDALFELRFTGSFPASEILPGILFSELKLKNDTLISSLPASQVPKALRDADLNLRFAPLSRLDWQQFFINIGDRSLSLGCKLPYPGWKKFKDAIIQISEILKNITIIQSIERYSIKYVDLLPSTEPSEQISLLNFDVTVGGHKLEKEAFNLRIEIPKQGFINAIQFVSSATVKLSDGTTREGVVVDVDTILNLNNITMQNLVEKFSDKLEAIHETNKSIFFNCLKPETIRALEPIYE